MVGLQKTGARLDPHSGSHQHVRPLHWHLTSDIIEERRLAPCLGRVHDGSTGDRRGEAEVKIMHHGKYM